MPAHPLSEDLRKRIVVYYVSNDGATYKSTAKHFMVGEASVNRILRVYREYGDVKLPDRPKSPKFKVDLIWLEKHVEAFPDARLIDRVQAFEAEFGVSVSISAMHNAMVAIKCTHKKKTIFASERETDRVRKQREEFVEKRQDLESNRLVFIDESGMRLGSTTRYTWGRRGKKVFGFEKCAWKTVTMIGAIALDGFRGFMNVDSATNGDVFRTFVEHELVPNLRPGDYVVMDNLSVHKNKYACAAIRAAGASIIYLPPYSPEWNPIEKAWAKMKDYIRRQITNTREQFDEAVCQAGKRITFSDILGWFQHCGYSTTSN